MNFFILREAKKRQEQQQQQQQVPHRQQSVAEQEDEKMEPIQSRSFKILQKMTEGFEEGKSFAFELQLSTRGQKLIYYVRRIGSIQTSFGTESTTTTSATGSILSRS